MLILFSVLNGCVGYAVYNDHGFGQTDEHDDSGLFHDATGRTYTPHYNYSSINVSKQEVIAAWGESAEKEKYQYVYKYGSFKSEPTIYKTGEKWTYNTGLSVGGFAPIVILPIPIFWWPTGYSKTYIYFRDDYVSSVYIDAGKMEVKCLMILPVLPICLSDGGGGLM